MANDFWGEPPIAIAHRGGDAAGKDQENTLKAFKAAREEGYHYGETDVILAASGEVVVVHGSRNWLQSALKGDLSRTKLQKMSLGEIRKAFRPVGIKVPTLQELLQIFPEMKFLVDPKTDEVILPLAKLIKKFDAANRVCVGSFSIDRIKQFIKVSGAEVPTSLIIGRGLRVINRSLLMLKTGRLTDVEAIQLHHSLVSREMIGLVHRHGLKALIFTCNSPLSIKNAINCAADGIISDRIELLKQLVQN